MTCELYKIRKQLDELQKRLDSYERKHGSELPVTLPPTELTGRCEKCGITEENHALRCSADCLHWRRLYVLAAWGQ